MSLPTPHRSLSPARLVRAAGGLQRTQRPLVFESKFLAQLAGLILYVMHMLVCVCVCVCVCVMVCVCVCSACVFFLSCARVCPLCVCESGVYYTSGHFKARSYH